MVEVIATDEFAEWYLDLNTADAKAVARVVGLLEVKGVLLDYPYSTAIEGSDYPIRELRIQSGGRPLRAFYAFDPKRRAVLLLGGDKTGDKRFYQTHIPKVERLWVAYLADLAAEGRQEDRT